MRVSDYFSGLISQPNRESSQIGNNFNLNSQKKREEGGEVGGQWSLWYCIFVDFVCV